ncbi:MAG: hypothetical protein J6R94_03605, partial [Agathobacter sp.]|nr:hypothetical protein [Agathobacter sp.]
VCKKCCVKLLIKKVNWGDCFEKRKLGEERDIYMTDKEFKRLNRAQLMDIIYQLQLQVENLTNEKQELEEILKNRRIQIDNAGNLAEAALSINDCFQTAQSAAEQYLSEIREKYEAAERQSAQIIAQAREEALAIIAAANRIRRDYETERKEDLSSI